MNKITRNFKTWLECNFGFYTMGVLVDNVWDSNVIYQYDPELDALKSSYNVLNLEDVTEYSFEKYDSTYLLNFYIGDNIPYATFKMCWISETCPNYFQLFN